MSNRWKIIFIATAFNLLFEYSLRGLNNLRTQPGLLFVLIAVYFTLFIMLEDLIVRFKLKAYQLMILAFVYGTIYCAYTSGILFINPTFAGISVSSWFYINVVWWGSLQAVLCFYIANVLSKRDWNHPRLSRLGWVVCLVINILMILIFQLSGIIPNGTQTGRFTVFIITLISLFVFIGSIKKSSQKPVPFQQNKFLNVLAFVTVVLFFFSAVFLTYDPILSHTSNVNASSLKIISFYTVCLSLSLLGYRLVSKKEIPV